MKLTKDELSPDKEKMIFNFMYEHLSYKDLDELILKNEGEDPQTFWIDGTEVSRYIWHLVESLTLRPYYRNIIKNNEPEKVTALLRAEFPVFSKYVNAEIFTASVGDIKETMAPFTISCLPKDTPITVNGRHFDGVDAITAIAFWEKHDPNICHRCERFPCFDSNDYDYENRYYNNFWFCSEDSEMGKAIMKLDAYKFNYCFASERLPPDLLPMVYYCDESEIMYLVY